MGIPEKRVFRFESFCLDLGQCSLRSGDREIRLRPKSFDVLCYLVVNAGRLVSKQELDEAIWPKVAVTDASLTQCIRELRDKLDDSERRLIKTVHSRGYMLTAVVSEDACEGAATVAQTFVGTPVPGPEVIAAERFSLSDATDREILSPSAETGDITPTVFADAATPNDTPPMRGRRRSVRMAMALVAGAVTALIVVSGAAAWFAGYVPLRSVGVAQSSQPLTMFRDCGDCPEMVVLPAFNVGANNVAERGKQGLKRTIAAGRFEVTVEQFSAFVDETGYDIGRRCNLVTASGTMINLQSPADADFRRQADKQLTGRHPAGCVSWHDAKAYVAWLAEKTGKPYRLLTGAEWEYAARAGTTGAYSFEGGISKLCEYGRFADLDSQFTWAAGCHSGHPEPGALPVGSLKPNPWGLFDVHGNVWEWVEDCISSDPGIMPGVEETGLDPAGCKLGVVRGGGWVAGAARLDAGFRLQIRTNGRGQPIGFRVGLTLDER